MFILLFLCWFMLNGRITTELFVVGLVVTLGIFAASYRHLGYTLEKDWQILTRLPVLFLYLGELVLEMTVSTWKVMGFVWSAKYETEPEIVEFDLPFRTRVGTTLMANYITLTPGTITVDVQQQHFRVHCLDGVFAPDPEGKMVQIIRRLEG